MNRFLLSPLFVATAVCVSAAEPVADVYARLVESLEMEVEALEQMQQAGEVEESLGKLSAALEAQQALLAQDEKELWLYIDNTPGVKQPLLDILSKLALEFSRIEEEMYFNHAGLKELLSPQIEEDPDAQKAKLEKIHAVDHDDD